MSSERPPAYVFKNANTTGPNNPFEHKSRFYDFYSKRVETYKKEQQENHVKHSSPLLVTVTFCPQTKQSPSSEFDI